MRARTLRARSPKKKKESLIRPGSRARLRALEALGGFDALSCNLSLIFKHSEYKMEYKTNIVYQILGGAPAAPPPPPDPPLICNEEYRSQRQVAPLQTPMKIE